MNWLDEVLNLRRIHGEWAELQLLREILHYEHINSRKLDEVLLQLNPRLARLRISIGGCMPASLEVGKTLTATVSGLDQFGQPFPIDFTANPASWSVDNTAAVTVAPPDQPSTVLTGVAQGSANLTVSCAGLSDVEVITVAAPVAVLTALKVDFS